MVQKPKQSMDQGKTYVEPWSCVVVTSSASSASNTICEAQRGPSALSADSLWIQVTQPLRIDVIARVQEGLAMRAVGTLQMAKGDHLHAAALFEAITGLKSCIDYIDFVPSTPT
tara:strand:- start:149 stop:490 length:342 start_codon:yes stop_codon:yes gene_type:complete